MKKNLAKIQQGRPWDFIKKKSKKLYKESTTKIKTTQEAEEATGQLRTKKRSQRRKAERLSSDILRAWNLASSKKEHFEEEKEGRPLSNIKLFRCFHMCQQQWWMSPWRRDFGIAVSTTSSFGRNHFESSGACSSVASRPDWMDSWRRGGKQFPQHSDCRECSYSYCPPTCVFFLLRMFLVFSLSIIRS